MIKQRKSYKRLCKMEDHVMEFQTFVIQRVKALRTMIKAEKACLLKSKRKDD